jgi:hypothetical protein
MYRPGLLFLSSVIVVACGATSIEPPSASIASSARSFESASPQGISDVEPVSASNPSPDAVRVFEACHIGDGDSVPLDRVTGMGMIHSARDLPRYIPLTGREPQLDVTGPVWIVTTDVAVPQPGSREVWSGPTCVVTSLESGWFATGPVTDTATGQILDAEAPAQKPDLVLPTLAP